MHVRRSLPRFAALLTAGLLLTSCGSDEPEPKFEAEPSPSTSASPSPSPSATPDRETAEEFIHRWVDEANAFQVDGQIDEFLAISPRCDACVETAKRIKTMYTNGGFVRTEGWTVRSIELLGRSEASATYKVRIHSAPTKYQETGTSPIKSFDGGTRYYQMILSRSRGSWRLDDYLDMGR